jgi:hypothetical protein
VPGIPESIVAEAGDGDVNLEWAAAHDDGGDSITHYRIRVWADSSLVHEMDVTGGSTRIEGLTNGVPHEVTISAVNTVGEGIPSTAVRVVPLRPLVIDPPVVITDPPVVIDPEIPGPPVDEPGSPTVIHAPVPPREIKILVRSRKRIVIGWEKTFQPDAPVLRYVVQTSRRRSSGFIPLCDLDWSSSQIELPRPRMGGLYVRIISVNDAGESEPSPTKKVF